MPDPWMDQPVSADAAGNAGVEQWGPDWWVEEAEEWVIVGLDSLLFGSGLAAEEEQWEWLRGVIRATGGRPVAVFLHKPLCLWDLDERQISQRAVTPEAAAVVSARCSAPPSCDWWPAATSTSTGRGRQRASP